MKNVFLHISQYCTFKRVLKCRDKKAVCCTDKRLDYHYRNVCLMRAHKRLLFNRNSCFWMNCNVSALMDNLKTSRCELNTLFCVSFIITTQNEEKEEKNERKSIQFNSYFKCIHILLSDDWRTRRQEKYTF